MKLLLTITGISRMKRIFFAIALMLAFSVWSKPVQQEAAARVAQHFWQANALGQWQDMKDVTPLTDIEGMYVFALSSVRRNTFSITVGPK